MYIQNAYAAEGFVAAEVDVLAERKKQYFLHIFFGMKQQPIIKALLKGFPIYEFLKTNLRTLTNHLRGDKSC
jgi:hypothetical protein